MKSKKVVYLDNAATTPVDQNVLEKMIPFFREKFGNPITHLYSFLGQEALNAIEDARSKTANLINAHPNQIVFTSSGTEANNMVIKGVAFKKGKGHIIVSKIEHHSVLHPVESLKEFGFDVTYIDVDSKGFIDINQVEDSIKNDTILISIMHANNEIGTIQPMEEVVRIAKEHGIPVHTDAVQSVGHINVDVKELDVDFLSVSAHKFNGPKSAGYLYIKDKSLIMPLIEGGAQEEGLRAATHNVPGIVGLGEASYIAQKELNSEIERLKTLKDYMYNSLVSNLSDVFLNGPLEDRLPQNLNVTIKGILNQTFLVELNKRGVIGGGGSACASTEKEPSHVLKAIGLSNEDANSSIRFSFGKYTEKEDIDYALDIIIDTVKKLRSMGN